MASSAGVEQAGSADFADRQRELFARGFSFSGYERDMVCLNLGGGRYLDVSGVTGLDSVTDGRGAVFGDFDDDGDLDVFLTTIQGPSRLLFRNEVGSKRGFLRIALEGRASGRDAFGATVRVKTSAGTLTKVKAGGSGYLAQSDPRLLFGLGDDERAHWVEVAWPSGLRSRFGPLPARSSWRLVEGEAKPRPVAEKPFSIPDSLTRGEASLLGVRVRPGETFPDLRARTLEGKEVSLSETLRPGRRILLNLWATWCLICRREMPALAKLRDELGPDNFEVVGLSLDDLGEFESVRAFVEERGIPYPILVANEDAPAALFEGSRVRVPLSFLLDGEGRVLEAFAGWSPRHEKRLRAAVDEAEGRALSGR